MSLVCSVSSCSSVKIFLIYFETVIRYYLLYPGRLNIFNMMKFSFISTKMLFALKFICLVGIELHAPHFYEYEPGIYFISSLLSSFCILDVVFPSRLYLD